MILSKTVKIKIIPKNIKYYKKMGYECKPNDILEVKICDLSKGSHYKVDVKCDVCGTEKSLSYKNYLKSYNKYNFYSCSGKCAIEKNKKTNIEKYSVENVMFDENIKKKIKKTLKDKYDDENYNNRNKFKKTCLEKYGVEHISKLDFVKEKTKKTCLEKYGEIHPLKNKKICDFIHKKRNKTLKIYGYNKDKKIEKSKKLFEEKGFELLSYDNKFVVLLKRNCGHKFKITRTTFFSRINYNINGCLICNPINNSTSDKENQIKNYLKELNIDYIENDRTIINPYELDIYIPSKKLAIEFNGLYWHSELYKDSNYHKEKTELCEEKGINLLHIYEDEWIYKQDIVKSIIKNKLNIIDIKIYARKCIIKEVDSKTTRHFLDNNHIQGFSNSSYKLGLYYNDELVSLMTFGYRRTNSKKEFELIRFCNRLNTNVVGAASKLFKHFIKNYSKQLNENYLISYADISLFDGSLYNTLGFSFKHRTKPNYFWVVDNKREHRFKYNKQNLIKEGADPLMTEREIMYEKGYYRIFGSGQDRYEFFF